MGGRDLRQKASLRNKMGLGTGRQACLAITLHCLPAPFPSLHPHIHSALPGMEDFPHPPCLDKIKMRLGRRGFHMPYGDEEEGAGNLDWALPSSLKRKAISSHLISAHQSQASSVILYLWTCHQPALACLPAHPTTTTSTSLLFLLSPSLLPLCE